MRKTLCLFIVVWMAVIVSCTAPSGPTEQDRVRASVSAGGDVASKPVRFPFTAAEEPKPAPETAVARREETVEPSLPAVTPPATTEPPVPRPAPPDVTQTRPVEEAPPPLPRKSPVEVVTGPPTSVAGELDLAVRESTAKGRAAVKTGPADAPVELSLEPAVRMALERNLKLKQQAEAVAEAEARLREKQNDFGPRLQFDYTIWTWHGILVSPVVSDPDIPVEGTGRAEMTLFLPVWVARKAREAAVHQAMEEVKVRRQDYDLKRSQVTVDVIKSYFAVLEAEESEERAEEVLDLNRQRLTTLEALREQGQILQTRVLLGRKFVASAVEEVKFRQADRVLALAKLKKLLDLPDASEPVIERPALLFPEVPQAFRARDRMRTDNPLLRRLYHERMSAYWTGRVRQFEEPRANIAIRYGVSFPRYEEFTDDYATIGLSVNWPVAKMRLDRAKRDQARHRVRQLELEEDIINADLDLDLLETHAAYLKAVQRLKAKGLEVDLAEENLRLSRAWRQHGTTDTQLSEDVFQVVVNAITLAEARMDYVKVKYSAVGLLADLYQRMGATDELVRELSRKAPEPAPEEESPEEPEE